MVQSRGQWSSRLGFVLAAAGSAVGLGNIWRFPYMAGVNGGGLFVLLYLLCVLFVALPVMLVEISLGRATQKNPVGALASVKPGSLWPALGYLALATGLGILSYYSVIAGRVFQWCVTYVARGFSSEAVPPASGTTYSVFFLALFMALTVLVVAGGVQRGIERWAKVLMPLLVFLMLLLILRSLLLPGAMKGVVWLLKPDLGSLSARSVLDALTQAFFSLSLGMGAMLTYGSYLSKQQDILTCGMWVVVFDTLIALMAGFMIFPAVFERIPAGGLLAAAFFFLLTVAALTSTVSLLEVVTAYFVDEKGWSRRKAVMVIGFAAFLVGVPSAIDFGSGRGFFAEMVVLGQKGFLSLMDFLFGQLSLALGSLLLCIFVGFVWGASKASDEIASTSRIFSGTLARAWSFAIRWVCPVAIAAILVSVVVK